MSTKTKKVPDTVEEIPDQETVPETKPAEYKAPTATKVDPKPAKQKCGFCVYLGPTIRAEIQSGTIYNASKDKVLKQQKELIEKYPLVAALIVPGDDVSKSRIKIATPGNLLYMNYRALAGELY